MSTINFAEYFRKGVIFFAILALLLVFIFPHIIEFDHKSTLLITLTILMSIFWIFSKIHYGLIGAFPFILIPLLNIATLKDTLKVLENPLFALIFGGMLIGIAFKKSNLHQRISFFILSIFGNHLYLLILAFMLSTYILSMTINNTVATMMGLMIAISSINSFVPLQKIKSTILIATAYGSLIGGNASPISSPAVTYSYTFIQDFFHKEFSFANWTCLAFPITLGLLFISSILLYLSARKNIDSSLLKDDSYFKDNLAKIGKISRIEIIFSGLLLTAIILWLTRSFINKAFPNNFLTDSFIAIFISFIMFFIPTNKDNKKQKFLLELDDLKEMPWYNFILIAGGLTLSTTWQKLMISENIFSNVHFLSNVYPFIQIVFWVIMVFILTEIMVNTVSVALLLPIICTFMSLAKVDPFLVAIIIGFSANSAFIMPSSTPSISLLWGEDIDKKEIIKQGILIKLLLFITVLIIISYFYK